MKSYKTIFEKIESTLIKTGSLNRPKDEIQTNLDKFKEFEGKVIENDEYFGILVFVIFYSGFKAATVNKKREVIKGYFSDYHKVAEYSDEDILKICNDQKMIKNEKKIRACWKNAKGFKEIVNKHETFQAYINSFNPIDSFENLMLLKEELEYRFDGLGPITTYHLLTDIGMPVLKPDRVICRIFKRLGLIESEKQFLKTIIHGRKFAEATGKPIRYMDIVFVAYGQVKSMEFGITEGICLEKKPRCSSCGIRNYCNYGN
jgi:DNA-3-methyladenine glycosylase I